MDGPTGKMPAGDIIGRFVTMDTLVHTWDLARTIGADERLDEDSVRQAYEALKPMDAVIRRPYSSGPNWNPLQVRTSRRSSSSSWAGRHRRRQRGRSPRFGEWTQVGTRTAPQSMSSPRAWPPTPRSRCLCRFRRVCGRRSFRRLRSTPRALLESARCGLRSWARPGSLRRPGPQGDRGRPESRLRRSGSSSRAGHPGRPSNIALACRLLRRRLGERLVDPPPRRRRHGRAARTCEGCENECAPQPVSQDCGGHRMGR